jgi:hypothetical protein
MARTGAADVRRADWRFLLPDPGLGEVAVAGTPEDRLVRALRDVAASVSPLPASAASDARYDVVVVVPAAAGALDGAAAHVRRGGWLYAETTGRGARAAERELRAAGLRDVNAHWLWPSATACREIVPLADSGAVRAALARRDPGARLRLRARAAALLAGTSALRLVLPAVAVIGRAP